MDDKNVGLYNKFSVHRRDGTSDLGEKHYGCDYFVLDLNHDAYAAPAIRAYITACETEFPELAKDLRKKLDGTY